jgi:diadenosine tetraphosphate (Ap4A) HIT family hydrolase
MTAAPPCFLCLDDGGEVLWRGDRIRVVAVDDALFPAYTRVIWNQHVAEMTQLSPAERNELMEIVWKVESAQREIFQPTKINLAQFGNMVPHLHWHVVPRWRSDSHFPEAIWAPAPHRSVAQQLAWAEKKADISRKLPQYYAQLQQILP